MTVDQRRTDYAALLSYATTQQRAAVEALQAEGSARAAAKALGIHPRNFNYLLSRLRQRAADQGYAPEYNWQSPVPIGHKIKGVSQLYGENNQVKLTWVKSHREVEDLTEALREVAESLIGGIKPVKPVKRPVIALDPDLLNNFVITDYHLGMKAFHEETRGEDWDTDIAEDLLVKWFAVAIHRAPRAHTAIFAQLGDFLHWDGLDAVTPTSRHILDADTRFQRLVRVAIRVIRTVIHMLLEKHAHVHVLMGEGNHDIASSVWLREMFTAFYENEPRVTIDNSSDPYYCYEHGLTGLFYHHGHKKSPKKGLDESFAAKFHDVFGRTKFRYGHTGHYHHSIKLESNLMVVEQHRTLAPSDAHSSRAGYSSGRDAQCITYSKLYGDVGRVVVPPEMAYSHV